MPIITNKYNLPDPIVRIAQMDTYSKGEAHISVTELIDAPQIRLLRRKYKDSIREDVSEAIHRMLGTAWHEFADKVPEMEGIVKEKRYFLPAHGWILSGAEDVVYANGDLGHAYDWKVTSIYKWKHKDFESWTNQINCYAYMIYRSTGRLIPAATVIMIAKDWSRSDAMKDKEYPRCPIIPIPIDIWSTEKQEKYISERILLHQQSELDFALNYDVNCSDSDRWTPDSVFAVFKPGGKRAHRLCRTEEEAKTMAGEIEGSSIDERIGKPARCIGNYCGVASVCRQWQAEQQWLIDANGLECADAIESDDGYSASRIPTAVDSCPDTNDEGRIKRGKKRKQSSAELQVHH